jgi:hypothetical protein
MSSTPAVAKDRFFFGVLTLATSKGVNVPNAETPYLCSHQPSQKAPIRPKPKWSFSSEQRHTGAQDIQHVGISVFRPKSLLPFFRNRIALNNKVDFPLINGRIFNIHEAGYEVNLARSILQKALIDNPKRLDSRPGEKGFPLGAFLQNCHQLATDKVTIVDRDLLCGLR